MLLDRDNLQIKDALWYKDVLDQDLSKLTLGEWDECCQWSAISNKWPEQIGHIHRSAQAAIPHLQSQYAKKTQFTELYELEYREQGLTSEEASAEVANEIYHLDRRLAKAQIQVELCEAEMAIRQALILPDTPEKYKTMGKPIKNSKYSFDARGQKIARTPIGTTYYVDADSGSNANAGTSTGAAWADFVKAIQTVTLTAGDIVIARRRTTGVYSPSDVSISFDESGNVNAPLTLTADFANAFSTDVNISGTATATLTLGSNTVTFSASVASVIAQNDWIYASGDDSSEHALHVASVSTSTVTLSLPYNGNNAGSGKTVINMGSNPVYGTTAQTTSRLLASTRFTQFSGLHIKTNNATGVLQHSQAYFSLFKNLILESGAGIRDAYRVAGVNSEAYNIVGINTGIFFATNSTLGGSVSARRCKLPSSTTIGVSTGTTTPATVDLEECDFSATTGDVVNRAATSVLTRVRMRNCKFNGSSHIANNASLVATLWNTYFEDYNNTPGDTRQYTFLDAANDQVVLQSDTGVSFTSGTAVPAKITPPSNLLSTSPWAVLDILTHYLYLPASATTLSVRMKTAATANWTANPLAGELYIEVSYFGHATNNYRRITKSTGTVNFAGSTAEQTLSVAVTPGQAGIARVRLLYGKPKESAKSNVFWVNPKFERS